VTEADEMTAFVTARLDEWQARAEATVGGLSGRWRIDSDGNVQDEETGGGGNAYIACGPWGGGVDAEHAEHIVAHDPASTLLLVASLRAIMAEHAPGYPVTYPTPSGQPTCGVCHAGGFDWDPENWPCLTARQVAAIFSAHPDYQEKWKP
jgi:hypothetical protein